MSKFPTKQQTAFSGAALALASLIASPAFAQQISAPWGFKPQNRASIAALMQQVERQDQQANVLAAVPTTEITTTTLVCGSDGASSARGNASCVILNNALGNISLGQQAEGNQSASSDTAISTTGGAPAQSGADDVLAALEDGNSTAN